MQSRAEVGTEQKGDAMAVARVFLPHFQLHCGLKLDGKDRFQSYPQAVVIKWYLRMSMKSSFKSLANKVSFSSSGNMVS